MKILVSDPLHEKGVEALGQTPGFEVEVNTSLAPEELIGVIKNYDGLVIRSGTKVNEEVIEAADRLKVIGRAGIGLDNVDIPAASYDSHLLAILGVPLNRSSEFSRRLAQAAIHQRGVFFVNTLFLELTTEMTVGGIVFRHHDDPAGIFVEAMDDPGPQWSP